MFAFLKVCLKGALTIILSPLWLLAFALEIAYSIILFFYMCAIQLIRIITKQPHKIYDTPYDKQAAEILANPNFKVNNPSPTPAPPYMGQPIYPSYPPQYYPPQQNYQNQGNPQGYPPPIYPNNNPNNEEEM